MDEHDRLRSRGVGAVDLLLFMDRENCHSVLLWVCWLGQSVRLSRSLLLQELQITSRHLERRLPVSGLERCPSCHPFASLRASSEPIRFAQGKLREGALRPASQTLRCAQGDRHSLHMSRLP